jgi:predicted hotdog family 3-hydroxylacyl-ACP dehydratase
MLGVVSNFVLGLLIARIRTGKPHDRPRPKSNRSFRTRARCACGTKSSRGTRNASPCAATTIATPRIRLRSHDACVRSTLCEYGAQAMAVHGGLIAREAGASSPLGMLVALRGVDLQCARIDDLPGALECEAESLVAGEGAQQYRFTIRHGGTLLAEGRAAVMLHRRAGMTQQRARSSPAAAATSAARSAASSRPTACT